MHSGASCASCRRPSRRHPRQPPPWSCPWPPLCLSQGRVCPPFFFAASRRPRAVSAFQRREHAKKWEVNSEQVLETVKKGVVNSQPGQKVDTFEKVVCTERSQAGGYSCATPTEKCTQEGFFPSQKRSCGTREGAPIREFHTYYPLEKKHHSTKKGDYGNRNTLKELPVCRNYPMAPVQPLAYPRSRCGRDAGGIAECCAPAKQF